MAQVIVNLTRVQVFESENGSNVNLVFNEAIKGFQRNVDANGTVEYVEGDVNYVSMGLSKLTAQLCECNDMIGDYRCAIDHQFGQKEFGLILRGAILTLEREFHSAGEVSGQNEDGTDVCYQRDCYTTEVVDVKLSKKAEDRLEKACEL